MCAYISWSLKTEKRNWNATWRFVKVSSMILLIWVHLQWHSTIQSVSTASPGQGYPRYAPTVLLKRSRIEVQSFQFWRIFFFRNSPLSITMVACIICILTWMRVTTVESYNASLWEKFKVNNSTLLCGLIALYNIETKNFKCNNFSGMKIRDRKSVV